MSKEVGAYWFEHEESCLKYQKQQENDDTCYDAFLTPESVYSQGLDTPFIRKLSEVLNFKHDKLLLILDGSFVGDLVEKLENQGTPGTKPSDIIITLPKKTLVHVFSRSRGGYIHANRHNKELAMNLSYEQKRGIGGAIFDGINYPTQGVADKVHELIILQ